MASTTERPPGEPLTLADFILARISEDEAVARPAGVGDGRWHADPECPDVVLGDGDDFVGDVAGPHIVAHIARHDSARVLAECEAKRQIVELHAKNDDPCAIKDDLPYADGWGDEPWPCPTLRLLALPYADHEDFQEEWRV